MTKDNTDELMPCPCGKTPQYQSWKNRVKGRVRSETWYVWCSSCDKTSEKFNNPKKAKKDWNTRPTPTQPSAGMDDFDKILNKTVDYFQSEILCKRNKGNNRFNPPRPTQAGIDRGAMIYKVLSFLNDKGYIRADLSQPKGDVDIVGYAEKDEFGDWVLDCLWSSEEQATNKGYKVYPVYTKPKNTTEKDRVMKQMAFALEMVVHDFDEPEIMQALTQYKKCINEVNISEPKGSSLGVDILREEIEEVISDTHELDVRDIDYANAVIDHLREKGIV